MNFSIFYQIPRGGLWIGKIFQEENPYVAPPTTIRLTHFPKPLILIHILFPLFHTTYPHFHIHLYIFTKVFHVPSLINIHNLFTSHSHFIHTFPSNLWYNYLNMKTNVNFFHILPYSKIFVHIVLLVIFFLYKHELYKNKFNIMEAIIL